MRGKWILRGIGIALLVVIGVAVVSFAVMSLWNWLVPAVIGWKTIDFWQALGMLVLARLLFGFRGFGGWHHRGHHRWKRRMQERWTAMTPEEREKFREGMRARCGH
jgi:hypothetical protein